MQRRGSFPHYFWIAILSIAAAFLLSLSCTEQGGSSSFLTQRASVGKQLMEKHCGTCHLPVSASALDKETWQDGVLPAMAPKLGIGVLRGDYYPTGSDSSETSVSMAEWMKIVEYYRNEAPDTLDVPGAPASLRTELPSFTVQKPKRDRNRHAATAMVEIDDATQRLYSSHVVAEHVYRWDQDLDARTIVQSGLLGVDARFLEEPGGTRRGVFTSIGATMRPNDRAEGKVRDVLLGTDSSRVIAGDLPRPVCSLPGDFNQDGLRDWIVCGFGYTRGGLYLLEQQPDRTFEKKLIRGVPGAVDARVDDFTDDGYPDVMVLFGQGDEGVWLFTNDQNGGFDSRRVLQFPPVYGSTNFQLVDFNGDGKRDILYTSGDNADYSRVLKPYHGIYIFLNQGNFKYKQSYFYHLNGATEAAAADFDRDGDLDIAAIAFFSDLENESAHNFLYLEQEQNLEFIPHAPPVQDYGRWLSMDVGDYDGDADSDLVLGNFSRNYLNRSGAEADSTGHLPFIVLENEVR